MMHTDTGTNEGTSRSKTEKAVRAELELLGLIGVGCCLLGLGFIADQSMETA